MTAQETVEAFNAALGEGDVARARTFLADDLHFVGPLDEFEHADDYVAALGQLARIVTGRDDQKLLADDRDVLSTYKLETEVGDSAVAEWATVRDGKIVELRVYFDPRPFAALVGAHRDAGSTEAAV
jgi:ketosteroid isomerase-like protein